MPNEQHLLHKISLLQQRYPKMAKIRVPIVSLAWTTTLALFVLVAACFIQQATCYSLLSSSSGFWGARVEEGFPIRSSYIPRGMATLQMRKCSNEIKKSIDIPLTVKTSHFFCFLLGKCDQSYVVYYAHLNP